MTIKELYEWAVKNEVENSEIVVEDYDGNFTSLAEPEIIIDNNFEEGVD